MSDSNNGKTNTSYKAYLQLLSANQSRIISFIRVMVPNPTVADDIMQETTLVMWEKFEKFRNGTNFLAWAFSIAKIKIMQYYSREKRQHLMFDEHTIKNLVDQSTVFTHGDEKIDALKKCASKLSRDDQKLLEMRYLDNINIRQIAEKISRSKDILYRRLGKIHSLLFVCIKRELANLE